MLVLCKILFWLSVFYIGYIYIGYPLVLKFIAGIKSAPKKSGNERDDLPTMTLFIPVHNEEKVIREKIDNALSLDYPKDRFEIVIASDGSTDKTDEIASGYKSEEVTVFCSENNMGKNSVINSYIPETKGEIIVFTDANSMFSDKSLLKLARHFSDTEVGCVGGRLAYSDGESSVAKGEGFYFKYENYLRRLEGMQGTMVGANGAIYAIRRSMFVPVPNHVPNDFFHPLSVLKRNKKVTFESDAIAQEKPSESQREEFRRRSRIVTRSFGAVVEIHKEFGLFSGIGTFNLISHKICRWFGFVALVAAFISNWFLIKDFPYTLFFLFQVLFYSFGAYGSNLLGKKKKKKLYYIPYYFILINLAGIIGLLTYIRGNRVVTWKSASTTR